MRAKNKPKIPIKKAPIKLEAMRPNPQRKQNQ